MRRRTDLPLTISLASLPGKRMRKRTRVGSCRSVFQELLREGRVGVKNHDRMADPGKLLLDLSNVEASVVCAV